MGQQTCLLRSSWRSADNRHHQWQDVLNLKGQQTLFVKELLKVSWQQTPSAAYSLESPVWVFPSLPSSHLSKWHNSQMWLWFLFERGSVLTQTWSPRSINCTRDDPELVSEESYVVMLRNHSLGRMKRLQIQAVGNGDSWNIGSSSSHNSWTK